MQKNNLLKTKRILKPKYKFSAGPVFTFRFPGWGQCAPLALPVSYATGKNLTVHSQDFSTPSDQFLLQRPKFIFFKEYSVQGFRFTGGYGDPDPTATTTNKRFYLVPGRPQCLNKLKQWFLTGGEGASINFQEGASPYALYNMESSINKYTNKCICFYSLFKVRGGLKQRTIT